MADELFSPWNLALVCALVGFGVLLDGLAFPEGPRWRDGKLWFSDMHDQSVKTVDLDGKLGVLTLKVDLEYWPTYELRKSGGVWERVDLTSNGGRMRWADSTAGTERASGDSDETLQE